MGMPYVSAAADIIIFRIVHVITNPPETLHEGFCRAAATSREGTKFSSSRSRMLASEESGIMRAFKRLILVIALCLFAAACAEDMDASTNTFVTPDGRVVHMPPAGLRQGHSAS